MGLAPVATTNESYSNVVCSLFPKLVASTSCFIRSIFSALVFTSTSISYCFLNVFADLSIQLFKVINYSFYYVWYSTRLHMTRQAHPEVLLPHNLDQLSLLLTLHLATSCYAANNNNLLFLVSLFTCYTAIQSQNNILSIIIRVASTINSITKIFLNPKVSRCRLMSKVFIVHSNVLFKYMFSQVYTRKSVSCRWTNGKPI